MSRAETSHIIINLVKHYSCIFKRNRTLESVFSKNYKNKNKNEGLSVYEIHCKNSPKKYIGQLSNQVRWQLELKNTGKYGKIQL